MFWNLFANENTKNFRRSMFWVEVLILVILLVLVQGVLFAVAEFNVGGEASDPQAKAELQTGLVWPGALPGTLGLMGGNALGGMLLIILVGAATAQEYNWRTMHLWVSRGVRRPLLLLAKFAGLLPPMLLLVSTALLAGAGISALFTLQLQGGLPFDQVDWAQAGLSILRSTYALLPYAGLSFLLAVATRSVVVAVGGGLAFSLLAESLLFQLLTLFGSGLSRLAGYLPSGLGQTLTSLNGAIVQTADLTAGQAAAGTLSPAQAVVGIALWTLLFLGLSIAVFQRQDLSD